MPNSSAYPLWALFSFLTQMLYVRKFNDAGLSENWVTILLLISKLFLKQSLPTHFFFPMESDFHTVMTSGGHRCSLPITLKENLNLNYFG